MNIFTLLHKSQRKVKYYLIKWKYEHTFKGQKYIFIPEKNSKKLVVVFSGFTGEKAKYNYIFTLKNAKLNKLFILDCFGYKGCYYLMENGSNYPELLVSETIENIKNKYMIDTVITAGSSKGGSAALYFGLKHGANYIISAACQFYIGSYLFRDKHRKILDAMMCAPDDPDYNVENTVDYLDNIIKRSLNNFSNQDINLYYSDCELTYERQMVPLMNAMKERGNFP